MVAAKRISEADPVLDAHRFRKEVTGEWGNGKDGIDTTSSVDPVN
jgi:hypothetical protein